MKEKNVDDRSTKILPRIAAYAIDTAVVLLLISMICNIRFINPNYDKYFDATETYNTSYMQLLEKEITVEQFDETVSSVNYDIYKYGCPYYVVALLVLVGYFGIFQKFNNGQTLGKKFLKIKVVSTVDKELSVLKYLLRLIPLYIYSYGGILTTIACIILPQILAPTLAIKWVTTVTIINLLVGLIDAEFMIMRKDRRALHDIISKTKIINE